MSRPKVHIVRINWIVPKGYIALTLNNYIFVRRDVELTHYLLSHELMHVLQWRRLGILGFIWQYGWTFARDGFRYRNIDLEEEARVPTPEAQQWAREILKGMQK